MSAAASKTQSPFHKRFAQLLRDWADEVEETGVDAAPPADPWVDQHNSPLGKTKHLELAKTGAIKASKTDRKRILMRLSDIDKYIEAHPVKVRARPVAYLPKGVPAAHDDEEIVEASLCRELGVLRKPGA